MQMALSRLFREGATRRFSSSSGKTAKASQSKKAEVAKEQKAVAVESFVKKYMQMNPGVFPKATHVKTELGGSWYLLKDILTELKEKMLSNPQIQKQITTETSDVTVGKVPSEAIKTRENLDTGEHGEPKSRGQPSGGVTDPHSHEKGIATHPPSYVTVEKSSGAVVRSEDFSDGVKLVEPWDGYQQLKTNSSTLVAPDRDHKAACKLASCLSQLVNEEEKDTIAFGGAENGDCQTNEKVSTSCVAPNGGSKAKEMPSSSGSAQRIKKLADIFLRRKMDSKAADDDTLTHETYFGHSNEASGEDSMRRQDIKGLLDRIKELPKDTSQTRSHDQIICNKMNQLNSGGLVAVTLGTLNLSDLDEQQKSLDQPYMHDKLKKHVLEKRQTKEPKETNLFDLVLQDMDKSRLNKTDDCIACDGTNQLNENGDDPTKKVPFEIFNSECVDESESNSEDAALDYIESKASPHIPLPTIKAPPKKDPNPLLFTLKGRNQTNLLVRFLRKSANAKDIGATFADCGPIAEIHMIPSRKESRFKDAYINFKTKEGLQRALAKTDVVVGGTDVIMEATSHLTNMSNRILAPDLVGDPDVPIALLESPTRTVMVKGLPQDLTTHRLKEAFSFCGHISGFFMGLSSSVAYVEFETEDAKEKAIASASVSISGRQLSIFRIDAPRTTVVRISKMHSGITETNLREICSLHGQIKRFVRRTDDTIDVHFKLAEWPNMVNILNSLNGQVVNGYQWIAQPATVIPVEILQSLWNQPDGRRHVRSVIQYLWCKLEENSTSLVKGLATKYYEEEV